MPQRPSIYEIEDPDTGDIYEIESESMPSADRVRSLLGQIRDGYERQPVRPWEGRPYSAEEFMEPEPDRGSAAGRFASGAWEMVNPVSIAKGLWNAAPIPQALGGSGVIEGPANTVKALAGAQREQFSKAKQAYDEGRYSEAVGHTGAGMLPIVGPVAANIGERAGEGDIAGAAGQFTGLVAPLGAAKAGVRAVKSGAAKAIPPKAATRLEKMAAERVTDVMAPKSNTQVGRRLGNKAEAIAPELAKDAEITGNWTRQGMQQAMSSKLDDATAMLDEAADARLAARTFDTQPLIKGLMKQREQFTAKAVEASQPTRTVTERASSILDERGRPVIVKESKASPVGRDVVPEPNQPRVGMIDQAISELRELGPVARYEDIRRIRQAYDGPAKVKYNPSMVDDFTKKQGAADGAADVTGTLREHLAKFDPDTAAANAQYSLYRNANDILVAAEQIERVRPKFGRQIMARLTGTVAGGQQAGVAGAAAGYLLGPMVDQLASAGVTTKLQSAKLMQSMATAIRKGDVGRVASAQSKLRTLSRQAAVSTAQATQTRPREAYE